MSAAPSPIWSWSGRIAASGSSRCPRFPRTPARACCDALQRAADSEDLPVDRLLAACSLFVHGSTVATNTVLEGKGARVAMLTTAGFRDSLDIRRGVRDDPWDHRAPYPPVLVPRYLRLPVRGRIDSKGRETAPLCADDVDAALKVFRQQGVEAVAVCLFNSFSNAAHESAAAEAVKDFPGGFVSVSSEITPIIGEYERSSTAVVNAYIAPRTVSYLRPRCAAAPAGPGLADAAHPEQRRRGLGRASWATVR